MSWDDCARTYGADKSSEFHDYMRHYKAFVGPVRSVLEIGVDRGRSLRAWADIFPSASIVGVDIDPSCPKDLGERIEVIEADATLPVPELSERTFDLIVDDGSHQVLDAEASFTWLVAHLRPGGTYGIEDLPVGVPGSPMSAMLAYLGEHPACAEIKCVRSAMAWGDAWPGLVLVRRA